MWRTGTSSSKRTEPQRSAIPVRKVVEKRNNGRWWRARQVRSLGTLAPNRPCLLEGGARSLRASLGPERERAPAAARRGHSADLPVPAEQTPTVVSHAREGLRRSDLTRS